jgi:hypothetical protein
LHSRTRNPALAQITGADVVLHKRHHAIGVCVGVLFSEGQRLWLARQQQSQSQFPAASVDDGDHSVGNGKSRRKLRKAKPQVSGEVVTAYIYAPADPEPGQMPVVSSAALDGIIDRIKYLEKKLHKPTQFGDPKDVRLFQQPQTDIEYQMKMRAEAELKKIKKATRGSTVARTHSNGEADERPARDDGAEPASLEADGKNQTNSIRKMKRPSSAPASRPGQKQSRDPPTAPAGKPNSGVYNRLYQQITQNKAESPTAVTQATKQTTVLEPGMEYIYDINGRRMVVTQEQKRRQEEAAFEARLKGEQQQQAHAPTPAQSSAVAANRNYDVQPFKKSVDQWVSRARKDLELKKLEEARAQTLFGLAANKPLPHGHQEPQTRSYAVYHLLEKQVRLLYFE